MRTALYLLVLALLSACATTPVTGDPADRPAWVKAVYPEEGAVVAVPDAVEVEHTITSPDEDIRLLVDGVDVTTYAVVEAGLLRYESGSGPVTLSTGDHNAEVQRVLLPTEGVQFSVVDSYSWEFRVG